MMSLIRILVCACKAVCACLRRSVRGEDTGTGCNRQLAVAVERHTLWQHGCACGPVSATTSRSPTHVFAE